MKKLILVIIILSKVLLTSAQETKNLKELNEAYVGEKFIFKGQEADSEIIKGIYGWSEATKKGKFYKEKKFTRSSMYIPLSYSGQEVEVIAIDLASIRRKKIENKTDAFGDKINPETIVDPYMEVVIKFQDGLIAMGTGYSRIFTSKENLIPLKEGRAREQHINMMLPSIIGKTVYADACSGLFDPHSNITELLDYDNRELIVNSVMFKPLEPLKIIEAKYIREQDIVIIKLERPNKEKYLTYSKVDISGLTVNISTGQRNSYKNITEVTESDFLNLLVYKYPSSLSLEISRLYTNEEISAIKNKTVFVGMSTLALYASFGYPDEENKNSYGGDQLIYSNNSIYIYLDENNEKISDWQKR